MSNLSWFTVMISRCLPVVHLLVTLVFFAVGEYHLQDQIWKDLRRRERDITAGVNLPGVDSRRPD